MPRSIPLALAFSLLLVTLLLAAPTLAQPLDRAGHADRAGRADHAEHGAWCHHGPPTAPAAAKAPAKAPAQDDDASSSDSSEAAEAGDEKGAEVEDEGWDVQNPPLPMKTVMIDVSEGTWMNLDVSPDGQWIVFDLLGDLYLLPMAGGEATALTQGLAWDMQPRFSPDGTQISFTSDREGGDNLFVMDLPGEGGAEEEAEPRQITQETFRLLNNAVWSPDGRFLAARKHFTSFRSLGAGEIWLYHTSGEGSSGLQLNDRPNEQKDLGEPAFSPDGRYVYYSRDATPGGTFEYSKDPNSEIYRIYRIDLETGETEPFVTGAGGAVRPTPSPDGTRLAFVRRLDYKTTLYVKDLETGAERPLYDGLDRDLQETWAIHGVYANFAWTPDSSALVFWADGGIHRLEIATGTLESIPFRVRQEHQLVEPVRYAQDAAPETFRTKALRWVQVSPDGSRVVFQALGKIWVRDLPDGEARRLTTQADHDEYHPSWSRDGRSVVYVSWDDVALGAVRRVVASSASGRAPAEGTKLTEEPGHFVEPALSPDGGTVVYRKTGGGWITSPLYSRDTGLYALELTPGAEPELLVEDGVDPHFGASSRRVYFQGFAAEGRRELRSVGLGGDRPSDRAVRTHASSEAATVFRVSPDGRWLAWTERYAARIVPFVDAVKPLQLGTSVSSLPFATVSRDAGNFLHWSGDSQTLHWSLGPELFERDLASSFAFLDGAPEELPEPPTAGLDLGFEVTSHVPEGVVALVGGRVVTFRDGGDEVIEDGTVVLEGDRIVAVGPRADVEVPAGAEVLDVTGHTVLPGFIDVHWHGSQGTGDGIVPERNRFHDATAAFGVTTVHDPSTDTHTFFAAAELQRAGERVAPRLFATGTILYGAAGSFKAIIDSADDARSHLRRLKALGAFSVKSYNQPRRDQRQQVIQAAHEMEMLVMPEGGSLFMHNLTQVVDGHTGIEHALPLARLYDDVVQLWSQTEVAYTPTLGVAYGGLWGENYWYAKTDVWANERLLNFVPKEFVAPAARRAVKVPEEEYNHIRIAEMCKKLSDAGVDVNLGAHGQREGLAAHWEMWMLEQGGMTPMEALRAGTWNGALYLGMEDQLGSLEEGKLADLVVVEGNPLGDLRRTEKVVYTVLGGRVFDASTMTEVGESGVSREPYWFEVGDVPLVVAE